MQTKSLIISITTVLLCATGLAAPTSVQPNSLVRVAKDYRSVLISLYNGTDQDIFCDSVALDVVLSNRDYNDFAARSTLQSGPIYLRHGEGINLNSLGSASALKGQGIAGVNSASLDMNECHSANFAEYCAWAPKSNDEINTVNKILVAAGGSCDDAEGRVGYSLNLSHDQIHSLVPVSFLRRLISLNVDNNQIDDINPLQNLSQLEKLSINSNPIRDLSPVLRLSGLKTIKANYTLVTSLADPDQVVHNGNVRIELIGTPYAKSHPNEN